MALGILYVVVLYGILLCSEKNHNIGGLKWANCI